MIAVSLSLVLPSTDDTTRTYIGTSTSGCHDTQTHTHTDTAVILNRHYSSPLKESVQSPSSTSTHPAHIHTWTRSVNAISVLLLIHHIAMMMTTMTLLLSLINPIITIVTIIRSRRAIISAVLRI